MEIKYLFFKEDCVMERFKRYIVNVMDLFIAGFIIIGIINLILDIIQTIIK